MLDIYTLAQRESQQIARRSPAEGPPANFSEAFSAALDADLRTSRSFSAAQRRYDVVQQHLNSFYQRTGQSLQNPESLDPENQQLAYAYIRKQFEDLAKNDTTFDLQFPDDAQVEQQSIELARKSLSRKQSIDERSFGFGSGAGAFAGEATGAMLDPINLYSMMMGAGATAGIARTALTEGAIAAGSEAAIQAAIFEDRQKIDPNHDIRNAANEVLAAAAGGAVFAGGIKTLAAGYQKLRGRSNRQLQDAGNVVGRQAATATPPVKGSARAEIAHNSAVRKAAEDVAGGKPVELPPEAFLESGVRLGRLYTSEGQSIGVRYELAEARDLITSHNDDFSANAEFPAELQPRERGRAISQDQINSISRNLQPERLGPSPQAESGAPIIGTDGLVESGNARVMAIRRAYQRGGTSVENYKNFLRSQNLDIEAFDQPVLVARRITPLDEGQRRAFVVSANRPTAMRLSATEQALADARLIDGNMLRSIDGSDLKAASNRPFVRGFMSKLPRSEQGNLIDGHGVLSQEGVRRVNAAVMGRAYGDPALLSRIMEDADTNIRGIGNALTEAAPEWARMREAALAGRIPPGMDITEHLLDAIRMVARARDESRPFRELMEQAEMFGGPSEIAKLLGRFMFKNGDLKQATSQRAMADMLREFAAEAEKNLAGERLIGEPLGTGDVLESTLKRAGRDDLASIAEDRLSAEAAEKLGEAPETEDQITREAERMIAARATGEDGSEGAFDLEVPALDQDGNLTGYRKLSDLMDEADAEAQAAKDIELCVAGPGESGATSAQPEGGSGQRLDKIATLLRAPRTVETDASGNLARLSVDVPNIDRATLNLSSDAALDDIIRTLRAPRSITFDKGGNAQIRPELDAVPSDRTAKTHSQRVDEILDLLRAKRQPRFDDQGNVIGDELA